MCPGAVVWTHACDISGACLIDGGDDHALPWDDLARLPTLVNTARRSHAVPSPGAACIPSRHAYIHENAHTIALSDSPAPQLRLRGGWCRGKTKQRVRRLVHGKKVPKAMKSGEPSHVCAANEHITAPPVYHLLHPPHDAPDHSSIAGSETLRPCTGSMKKSQIERIHGSAMVASVLRGATPRSFVFDPRTAMLRHGMRMDKHDVPIEAPFNPLQKGDVNSTLIKVCQRGKWELVEDLCTRPMLPKP